MQWKVLSPIIPTNQTELKQVLLQNRGITDESTFLTPPKPATLSLDAVGLDEKKVIQAIARIQEALEKQHKIVVFGDYDADGICATAVLWLTLHELGCNATPFIPERMKHGYGLSLAAIDDLIAQGKPDLVITVDNGIVAHAAVEKLTELGVEVVITDHHSPEATLPPAQAFVHTTQLCGTTVAWMLSRELQRAVTGQPENATALLDLCGIATIADQVPLKDANRDFAYWGVEALKTTPRPGIKAICQIAEINQPEITTNSVHYGIAPRINAMGRLEHGLDALRLLCTTNTDRAQSLAQSISQTNVKRQNLTIDMVDHALLTSKTWENEHLIIVHSTEYHEGVIGLIAGKLMETYFKPAIVIAVGDTKAKASARSIPGVNIVELIRLVKDDLLEVGGHPMAAGFGLLTDKIETVKEKLLALAKEQISAEDLVPQQILECILDEHLLTTKTTDLLKQFEPYGQGNHEPLFGCQGMKVLDVQTIGQRHQHLKLQLETNAQPVTALGWGMGNLASSIHTGETIDVAASIELNIWKNRRNIQLKLKDVSLPTSQSE